MSRPLFEKIIFVVLFASLLTGCSGGLIGLEEPPTPDPETLITPVGLPAGINILPVLACKVGQWAAVQTNKPQGELLAWSPDSSKIAFTTPVDENWGWYNGNLEIVAPGQTEPIFLSQNIQVTGDLTWSDDNNRLAFVALRPGDRIYTVMLLDLAAGTIQDLLPDQNAVTDEFGSMKGIQNWLGNRALSITSSCGTDCLQVIEIDTLSISSRITGEIRKKTDLSLSLPITPGPTEIVDELDMSTPFWSRDFSQVLYMDDDDLIWVYDPENRAQFRLDIPDIPVREAIWSLDGKYMAVRTDFYLRLYEMDCQP